MSVHVNSLCFFCLSVLPVGPSLIVFSLFGFFLEFLRQNRELKVGFRILFFLTFEVLTDSINFVILLDGFLGFKVVGFLSEEEIFDQIPNPIF